MPDTKIAARRGRPATGKTRKKVSISLPTNLAEDAMKAACERGESFSQFVARSIQNRISPFFPVSGSASRSLNHTLPPANS